MKTVYDREQIHESQFTVRQINDFIKNRSETEYSKLQFYLDDFSIEELYVEIEIGSVVQRVSSLEEADTQCFRVRYCFVNEKRSIFYKFLSEFYRYKEIKKVYKNDPRELKQLKDDFLFELLMYREQFISVISKLE